MANSTGGEIIKWGAITLGAYFVSRSLGFELPLVGPILDSFFGAAPIPVVVTTPGTTSTSTQTNTTQSANTPSSSTTATKTPTSNVASGVKALMLNVSKLSPTSTLNWDQWNYYYQKVTGSFASVANADRTKSFTVDQWLSYAGLSGVGLGNYFYNKGSLGTLLPIGPYAVPIVGVPRFGFRGLGAMLYKDGGFGARNTESFRNGGGRATGAEKLNIRYLN